MDFQQLQGIVDSFNVELDTVTKASIVLNMIAESNGYENLDSIFDSRSTEILTIRMKERLEKLRTQLLTNRLIHVQIRDEIIDELLGGSEEVTICGRTMTFPNFDPHLFLRAIEILRSRGVAVYLSNYGPHTYDLIQIYLQLLTDRLCR